ncbi:MAG: hypothetical protein M0R33_11480 [Methylomonas sp.]|uniref:hypothetical protein n=1 Tax=Methylomonas sp. TaxID=418 RepID=UPI0025EF95B6|nr:hypothetical protein [Methylomonas sp.]MCK9607055.1 hypothetical protein [Methylomonas sp.]
MDTPKSIWLPLRPDSSGSIALKAYKRGESAVAVERSMTFSAIDKPQIVMVTDGVTADGRQALIQQLRVSDHDVFTSISAQALPRFGTSYASVHAVVMHFSALQTLEDRQIKALSRFLMQCGSMIALAFPDPIFKRLKQLSGCQGNFLVNVFSADQLAAQRAMLEKPSALPVFTELLDTRPRSKIDQLYTLLVIFCLGYLLIGFIAVGVASRQRTLFILPLISAGIALLVWGHRQPDKVLSSWLEMGAGQSSAWYSARLTLQGTGFWRERIELPIEAVYAANTAVDGQMLMTENGSLEFPVEYGLLSQNTYHWQSGLSVDAPLSLAIENGMPVVVNSGPQLTKQGLFRWRGSIYILPSLQPGHAWRLSSATAKAEYAKIVEMFAKQSRQDSFALLIPFSADILPAVAQRSGWLLIHGANSGVL